MIIINIITHIGQTTVQRQHPSVSTNGYWILCCNWRFLRAHLLKYITTNQFPSQERRTIYMEDGGYLFVTHRILIVHLLTGVVPCHQVDGIMVWNSHLLTESSIESFILRVSKQLTSMDSTIAEFHSTSSTSTIHNHENNNKNPNIFIRSPFIHGFSTDAFLLSRNEQRSHTSRLESVMKLLFRRRVFLRLRFRLGVMNLMLQRLRPLVQ